MPFNAGIEFTESQQSLSIIPEDRVSVGGHVEAYKGRSFEPILKSSPEDWIREFGPPDPSRPSSYSILLALKTGAVVHTVRVHSGARIAAKGYGTSSQVDIDLTGDVGEVGIDEDATGINDAGIAGIFSDFSDPYDTLPIAIRCIGAGAYGNNIAITIDKVNADGSDPHDLGYTFRIRVFENSVEKESYTVSRDVNKTDASGKVLYIESVINGVSEYIRAYNNTAIASTTLPIACTSIPLTGGDNGDTPGSSDFALVYSTILPKYTNNKYDPLCKFVMEGGGAAAGDTTLAVAMADYALANNSFAILGVPQSVELGTATSIAAYSSTTLASAGLRAEKGSYCGLWSSWMYINDPWNGGEEVLVPIDGLVAQVMVRSWNKQPWKAPSGTRRGQIGIRKPLRTYDDTEQEVLAEANINFAILSARHGFILWNQRTMHGNEAARVSRIHVRNGFNYLKSTFNDALLDEVFEYVDDEELSGFAGEIRTVLRDIKSNRGLAGFKVVAKIGVNNTAVTLAARKFIVTTYVDFVRVGEAARMDLISTDMGPIFDDQELLSSL